MAEKTSYPIDVGLPGTAYRYEGEVECPYCGSLNTRAYSLEEFTLHPVGIGHLSVNAVCFDCVHTFTSCMDFDFSAVRRWSY